jgi:hypothetical protein
MTKGNDAVHPILPNEGFTDIPLTKREYFSIMILQGLMANPERYKYIADQMRQKEMYGKCLTQAEATAKNCHKAVKMADALIEELNRGEQCRHLTN